MAKVDVLFDELIKRGATDLHLAGGCPPLVRIRGELVPLRDAALDKREVAEMVHELLSPAQRAKLDVEGELCFGHAHREAARLRASCFQKSTGLGATFRLVPPRIVALAELGCPDSVAKLADRRSGLVVVAGPKGSGKSTAVSSMIDHVNKTRACHVLTIEEPIEVVHEPLRAQITQREVGEHAPSQAAALASARRENADVVVVDGLEGAPAIKLALELVGSGVLVLATVSANGVLAAVESMVHAFPAEERARIRGVLADALAGIVSLQILRTADNKARVAVYEVLVGGLATQPLLREGKMQELAAAMEAGQSQGMQTMDMALERLLQAGRITAEAALDRAVDKEGFAHVVARLRPDLAESVG